MGSFRRVSESGSRWKCISGRSSGVCAQVSSERSVRMGLMRTPVMPKQAFLASETVLLWGPAGATWPKPMFLTSALTERYKPQNAHRENRGEISDPRPIPKLATSTNAAALNSPLFLERCDLLRPPKTPKPKAKNQKKSHAHSGIRTSNRQYAYVLALRPLPPPSMMVGSSWPEQKMGSFGSFLFIEDFFGDGPLFGCPPFCSWQRTFRGVSAS